MNRRSSRHVFPLVALLSASACQCDQKVNELTPKISVSPTQMTFSMIASGTQKTQTLQITNSGLASLFISSLALQDINDITISSVLLDDCSGNARTGTNVDVLSPGQCAAVNVTYTPMMTESVSNVIVIDSNDPVNHTVQVPITATGVYVPMQPQIQVCVLSTTGAVVASDCTTPGANNQLTVPTLAFGTVEDGQTVVRALRIIDTGTGTLSVPVVRLSSASSDLSLPSPPPLPITLTPSDSVDVTVQFVPTGSAMISGVVEIQSDSVEGAQVDIPITAQSEMLSCQNPTATLSATVGGSAIPSSGVLQDTTVDLSVSVSGGTPPVTQYTWTLLAEPPGNTSMIVPGGATVPTAEIDCGTPGVYVIAVTAQDADGCTSAQATVAIHVAALPPVCGPATEFIYTVDEAGDLFQFEPGTQAFTRLGPIGCNGGILSSVNTMAVDIQGIAWVEYQGGALYKVDTTTLTCYPSGLRSGQVGGTGWGSCFAANAPGSTAETYYVADKGKLLTIDITSLAVSTVGTFGGNAADEPELTGTPAADLFGLFPPASGLGTGWTLAQFDRTSGMVMTSAETALPIISSRVPTAGNWAFASWGSDFWFFVGGGVSTDVFHYSASTQTTTLATTNPNPIVGAGVSPCVQMQIADAGM